MADNSTLIPAVEVETNGCEGCQHCIYAGIRWPASPDGFTDLSYVDKCDYCDIYPDDDEAAKAIAAKLGVRWGYAYREALDKFENEDDNIRWEPAENDGLDYTGWSAFVVHPARDGDGKHIRGGKWFSLTDLSPGQGRALIYAIQEACIHMAAEWASGEVWAVTTRQTLDSLRDDIQNRIKEDN
jgi:hypothetical protein